MVKTISTNRQAKFNFEFIDSYTAGIVLLGIEIKSVRAGEIDLKGSFVAIKDGELFLTNAYIKPYRHAGEASDYDPTRSRKLLLQKSEIKKLIAAKQNGLTIVPVAILLSGKYIKVKLAAARGKKTIDKRQTIQKRDVDREIEREAKHRTRL